MRQKCHLVSKLSCSKSILSTLLPFRQTICLILSSHLNKLSPGRPKLLWWNLLDTPNKIIKLSNENQSLRKQRSILFNTLTETKSLLALISTDVFMLSQRSKENRKTWYHSAEQIYHILFHYSELIIIFVAYSHIIQSVSYRLFV